ncbi:MAG: dTDP-4-dehydrorhamnose reductase [Bacteroidales bacterium]|nr:dTDP-4-dehydrorhamnose reductase [Bacteroidales bacterium]
MKVLITGAAGQLGHALRCMAPDFIYSDITGEDNVRLDITDAESVNAFVESNSIDTIINCAAYTDVEAAEDNPELAELLNCKAVGILAEAMKAHDGLLVHMSTDYIFGGDKYDAPIREDCKPNPTGAYGLSKLHGEEAILNSRVRHLIIRTAWLFSPWGRNFVKTMLRLTSERPVINVVNDQKGTPTYAPDLAAVILAALEAGCEGIYNYTDEGECTWYEFAVEIARLAGNTACEIRPCLSSEYPSKVRRPSYSVLDKTLVKETLEIGIPQWQDSLKECIVSISKSVEK